MAKSKEVQFHTRSNLYVLEEKTDLGKHSSHPSIFVNALIAVIRGMYHEQITDVSVLSAIFLKK
jgi:hypothetical protein